MLTFSMEQIPQVNNYIQKIFDYYNGKINRVNYPARLIIDWANRNSDTRAGTTSNPDLVYIYPSVMCRYTDDPFQFYYIIISTIIHELYHVDQDICYLRLIDDKEYVRQIEDACECQTMIYVANNIHEIHNQFGIAVKFDFNVFSDVITKLTTQGSYYNRLIPETHIIHIASEVLSTYNMNNKELKILIDALVYKDKPIEVFIEGKSMLLMDATGCFAPINVINNFFYNNFFRCLLRSYHASISKLKNSILLDIRDLELSNIMVRYSGGE